MKTLNWDYELNQFAMCRIELFLANYSYTYTSPSAIHEQRIPLGDIAKELLDTKLRIVDMSSGRLVYEGTIFDLALSRLERIRGGGGMSAADVERIFREVMKEATDRIMNPPLHVHPIPMPEKFAAITDPPLRRLGHIEALAVAHEEHYKNTQHEFYKNTQHEFVKKHGTSLCGHCSELADASCHIIQIA